MIGPVVQTQRLVILLSWKFAELQAVQTVADEQAAHPAGQALQVLEPGTLYYPVGQVAVAAVVLCWAREAEVTVAWPSLLLRFPFFSLSN